MSANRHWAYGYIGKPWRAGGLGPDTYNCWGLVQAVLRDHYKLPLPGTSGLPTPALFHAAREAGWRATSLSPREADVVVMFGPDGRHVGVMIEVAGRMRMLHSDGSLRRGPSGGVVCQSLHEAATCGYHHYRLWRHA